MLRYNFIVPMIDTMKTPSVAAVAGNSAIWRQQPHLVALDVRAHASVEAFCFCAGSSAANRVPEMRLFAGKTPSLHHPLLDLPHAVGPYSVDTQWGARRSRKTQGRDDAGRAMDELLHDDTARSEAASYVFLGDYFHNGPYENT